MEHLNACRYFENQCFGIGLRACIPIHVISGKSLSCLLGVLYEKICTIIAETDLEHMVMKHGVEHAMKALLPQTCFIEKKMGRRTFHVHSDGSNFVLKLASNDLERAGLLNEKTYLSLFTDRVVSWSNNSLLLKYIEGDTPFVEEPTAAYAVLKNLALLHKAGIVLCDLKPDNLIVCSGHVAFLDWEFATQIGPPTSELLRRPYSSGWTHPDLIWAKGKVDERFDIFPINRMIEFGFLTR